MRAAARRNPGRDVTITRAGTGAKAALRLDLSPGLRGMLDYLCDGRWHDKDDTIALGTAAVLREEYDRAVKYGQRSRHKGTGITEAQYAESGANYLVRGSLRGALRGLRIFEDTVAGKLRMPAGQARQWRRDRSAQEAANPGAVSDTGVVRQRFGDEQVFGDMLEFDAWAYSPLRANDVAYVRPNIEVELADMRAAFPAWTVTMEPDGLVSIAAPVGTPVKDLVTAWLAEEGIFHEGVRDARNVKRRDINELPPDFLRELVAHYTRYAQRRVRERHAGSMQMLVGDPDDIAGTVALWVMESIAGFDASRGVPFGAWLTQQLPNKVMDLNRASFGRTAADAEMRRARVIEAFEGEFGRAPTRDELRRRMGMSPDEMSRKERDLSNLRGLRTTATIETGPDEQELPVVDLAANPEADVLNLELMQSVSRALLASSGEWDEEGKPVHMRPLGFLIVYLMHWQEWTKGDLTILAGKAARAVSEEVDAVQRQLVDRLEELREGRTQVRTNDIAVVG